MTLRLILGVLLVANVVAGIGVVNARHQHRELFTQLTALEHVRDELNIEFGRLQLEQATWSRNTQVDQVARERLGMKFPDTADIVVVRP